MSEHLSRLVDMGDVDELLREIDRICETRDWGLLDELREKCRLAVATGRQLWGVAGHAEYRMALEAPPHLAATVVDAQPGPFVPGPLPEVLARVHGWAALSPHLPPGPFRHLVAYECVAAGENLAGEPDAAQMIRSFELPLALQAWEPTYGPVSYRSSGGEFAKPRSSGQETQAVASPRERLDVEVAIDEALARLFANWTADSNGSSGLVCVEGNAASAIEELGEDPGELRSIELSSAVEIMAWAGASGGFSGRRSGAASGRAKAWWAVAALLGEANCDVAEFVDLVADADDCSWFTWGHDIEAAMDVRIAMTDASAGMTYAFSASDTAAGGTANAGPTQP